MKKKVNWLGFALIGVYILVLVLCLILGIAMDRHGQLNIRNIFYGMTLGWFLLMLPLGYVTLNKTWYKILPEIKSVAKIVNKKILQSSENIGGDLYRPKWEYTLSFELPNKKCMTFPVTLELYDSVNEKEIGELIYKEQGKRIFLVSFKVGN